MDFFSFALYQLLYRRSSLLSPRKLPKPHCLPLILAPVENTWGPFLHPLPPNPSLDFESFRHPQSVISEIKYKDAACVHPAFPEPSPGGKLINKMPSIIHGTPHGGRQATGAGWTRHWNSLNNSQAVSGL